MTKRSSNNDPFGSIPIAEHIKQPPKQRTTSTPSFSRQNVPPKNHSTFLVKILFLMLILGIALYLATSFLLLPYLIKGPIAAHLAKQLGRSVTIAKAQFNPISLNFTISNAIIGPKKNDANDSVDPFLSFSSLEINFAAVSLTKSAIICQDITLWQPYVHISQVENSPPNIFEAADKLRSIAENIPKWLKAITPKRYSINNITIAEGEIRFDDQKTDKGHLVSDLSLTFPSLANIPYQTPSIAPSFTAKINGNPVALQKMANLPGKGETRISIQTGNLNLAPYSTYLLPKSMSSASVQGLADIDLELVISHQDQQDMSSGLKASLEGLITLKNLVLQDKNDWATIESMTMQGIFSLDDSSPTYNNILLNTPNINLDRPLNHWLPLASSLDTIEKLKVINGSLTLLKQTNALKGYRLQRINAAFDFDRTKKTPSSTEAQVGSFIVNGMSGGQGRFNSQGVIGFSPFTSTGQLSVEQMPIGELPPILRQQLAFIDSGQIQTIQTKFTIESSQREEKFSTKLEQLRIQGQDLTVKEQGETLAVFGSWKSNNGSYSQLSRTLNVGNITIARGELYWIRKIAKDSVWHSLANLVDTKKLPLKITRDSLELRGRLVVNDQKNPKLHLTLNSLHIRELPEKQATLFAEANINRSAPVTVTGTYTLSPFAATLNIKANDLSLSSLSPPLQSYFPAKVQGRLDINGELTFPAGSYSGQLEVNNFKTTSGPNSIEWQQAQSQALTIQLNPLKMEAEQVQINNPRLSYTSPQNAAEEKHTIFTAEERADIKINSLRLLNGQFSYHTPWANNLSFHALDAQFSGIDFTKKSKTAFALTGLTKHDATLTLSGNIATGLKDFHVVVEGGLHGINLAKFSPQTAPFIGYKITAGTGALTGSAIITANDLSMNNTFSVQGLKIGSPLKKEKIHAKGESWQNLPFLQALLQNSRGKIEIKLPIDSQSETFSPGRIAQNRLRGLLLKSIVSPFSLLNSNVDNTITNHIIFGPGEDKILPAEEPKLEAIAYALKQRPLLHLQIAAYADRKADRSFFKKQQEVEIKRRQLRHEERLSLALSSAYGKEIIEEGVPVQAKHNSYIATRKITVTDKELQDLAQRRGRVVKEFFENRGVASPRLAISKSELVNPSPLGRPGSRVDFSLEVGKLP